MYHDKIRVCGPGREVVFQHIILRITSIAWRYYVIMANTDTFKETNLRNSILAKTATS